MRILFITPNPLGDTVLSLGILSYLYHKYAQEGVKFTIATGPLGESLFEGFPALEEIISLKKQKRHGHWVALWRHCVGRRWDYVVDMRNSAVSRLVPARRRYIKKPGAFDPAAHVVVQNAGLVWDTEGQAQALPPYLSPYIWVSKAQEKTARELLSPENGPYLAIGPTATFPGKIWPVEYYVELMQKLTSAGEAFADHKVVLFGAPGEEKLVESLTSEMSSHKIVNLVGRTSPGVGAACLAQCDFYIGNDSGVMHMAAAMGVPTLGLFGPSRDDLYRPWGAEKGKTSFVRTPESFAELAGYPGFDPKSVRDSLMYHLTIETVYQEVQSMIVKNPLRLAGNSPTVGAS